MTAPEGGSVGSDSSSAELGQSDDLARAPLPVGAGPLAGGKLVGDLARRREPPSWCSPREACVLIVRGYTARTGLAVASLVGTILSGVNEGAAIVSGHVDASTWVRVGTNYLVPFLVASVGYLAPFRRAKPRNK